MRLMQNAKKVVIVGGGISGLSTAYYLTRCASQNCFKLDVVLVEKERRLGGKILTEKIRGCLVDAGPDSFLSSKPWAINLCQELGLGNDLINSNPKTRKTKLLLGKKLVELPESLMLITPLEIGVLFSSKVLSPLGKLRMGLEPLIPRRFSLADESLASFIRRRFGVEVLERIAEPLLAGIYAGKSEELSLKATFPILFDLEKKYKSVILALLALKKNASHLGKNNKWTPFVTLKHGLSQLIVALADKLKSSTQILTSRPAIKIAKAKDRYEVLLDDGKKLTADALVLASPAYLCAGMLSSLLPKVAPLLEKIPYVSTQTVVLAYPKKYLSAKLDSYGFLVSKAAGCHISACTYVSSKWPNRTRDNLALLRLYLGGRGIEDHLELPNSKVIKLVEDEISEILRIKNKPVFAKVFRFRKAMPQYTLGHLERVQELENMLEQSGGLFLTGAAYRGVGLPDCIHQANQSGQKVLDYLF